MNRWIWVGKYHVLVDYELTILEAKIEVKCHDKAATMRRVTDKVTLSRIQEMVKPRRPSCPSCGAFI